MWGRRCGQHCSGRVRPGAGLGCNMGTEQGRAEQALLRQICLKAREQVERIQMLVVPCRAALLLPTLVDYPDHFGPPNIRLTDPRGMLQAQAHFVMAERASTLALLFAAVAAGFVVQHCPWSSMASAHCSCIVVQRTDMQCRLLAMHHEQSGVSFGVMAVSHSLGSSVACRTVSAIVRSHR